MTSSQDHLDAIDPVRTLKSDLLECGIRPNRLKGQNYLISQRVRDRIVDCAMLVPDDSVLEIGAGTGILTWALAARSRDVWAVEQEQAAVEFLRRRFEVYPGVRIIDGDGLDVLRSLAVEEGAKSRKIISNLPYSISSPVLMVMADHPHRFPCGVFLLQREVVERVVAPAGSSDRSALSVLIQLRYDTRQALTVKASHFRPVPRVDSAVLVMHRRGWTAEIDWHTIRNLVMVLFRHRRKTVFNNLREELGDDLAARLLQASGINAQTRAQDLPGESFIHLSERMSQHGKAKTS